jgi:hypothetical protein
MQVTMFRACPLGAALLPTLRSHESRSIVMPAHARKDLVRDGEVAVYHVWSRCVQSVWLCGLDPRTGIDYSYRKDWIEKLLRYQADVFAIDVGSFHLLSNHKHAVLCTRPDLAETWSDEEVAWRWKMAWPRWENNQWLCEPSDQDIREVLSHGSERIEQIRCNLSSLSWFMARWKEPVARAANEETETRGHMWAERYGCRELTSDGEILVALAYNDMQQVRCGAADSLAASHNSSIQLRLRAWAAREAAEAVTAFNGRDRDVSYDLDPAVVEEMLISSWLMPYSDKSPLFLMRHEDDAEHGTDQPLGPERVSADLTPPQPPPGEPKESEKKAGDDVSPPEERTTSSLPPGNAASDSSARKTASRRKERTRCIHTKLLRILQRPRPRRPLLELPFSAYLQILTALEKAAKQPPQGDPLIDAAAPPRAAPDATPTRWRKSFAEFQTLLKSVTAGLPPHLQGLVAPRGDPRG